MSTVTIPQILKKYQTGDKLTMLTAYDASFAKLVDRAGIDIILVGDSLGMVMQGHTNTLPVTLDQIIYHTQCVTRVVQKSLVLADMPFMSYQASTEQALMNAGRCLKEGMATAIKMEGGAELVPTITAMRHAGIPVMGHIGLQPQQIHTLGGYKIQGKTSADAEALLTSALALQEAGCFAIVLEGVAIETAAAITGQLKIPTIGIASGSHCSGQVQVMHDLLGMDADFKPRHAKAYIHLSESILHAIREYTHEVENKNFPTEEHATHRINDENH